MGPLSQYGREHRWEPPQRVTVSLDALPPIKHDTRNPLHLICEALGSNPRRPTQRHRRALYQKTAKGRERVVLSATYGRRERESPCAGVLFRPGNRRRKAAWFDSTSSTWGPEEESGSVVACILCEKRIDSSSPPAALWCSGQSYEPLAGACLCDRAVPEGSSRPRFKSSQGYWEVSERGRRGDVVSRPATTLTAPPRAACSTLNIQDVESEAQGITHGSRDDRRHNNQSAQTDEVLVTSHTTPLWTHSSVRTEYLASNSSSASVGTRLPSPPRRINTAGGSDQNAGSSNLSVSV